MAGYRPLGRLSPGLDGVRDDGGESYDWEAAANAALAAIFRSLIPSAGAAELQALDALEATFDRRLSRDLSHGVRSRSRQRGRDAAAAVFAWSQGDGGHEGYRRNFPPYVPGGAGPVGAHAAWIPLGSPAELGVEPDVRDRRRSGLPAGGPSAVLGRAGLPVPK